MITGSVGTNRAQGEVTGSRGVMLTMATVGFAVNFWAWALLSPLGPLFRTEGTLGDLTESDVALLVAVPVLVGSLGRIPVGALTDKFGGRVMFPVVSAATIVPVLFIGFFGLSSYAALLAGGFFLGIGGTTFAVGVPFVNAWFPPERRGLAVGIFGAGMGGTAISALTTVTLYTEVGEKAPFLITAGLLAVYAVVAWFVLRDAPGRTAPAGSMMSRVVSNAKLPISWQACILYAVAFGGYVAFSVYLPSYLKAAYDLTAADAANRMAGFVVIAVIMRPVGGWFSDRKMSDSGCLPIPVSSDSRKNLLPAFGPRFTMRTPRPPSSSSGDMWISSSSSDSSSAGANVTVVSWWVPPSDKGAPHDEQKLDPSGFWCPQFVQYI